MNAVVRRHANRISLVTILVSLSYAANSFATINGTEFVLRSFFDADLQLCYSAGQYSMPSLSQDGRFITFSATTDFLLPPGGHGIAGHVYVLDRDSNELERISARNSETPGVKIPGDKISWGSSISADGRYVAFISRAANLVDGDTNGSADIFLHDRLDGSITRLTPNSPAGTTGGWPYKALQISADGRQVAFATILDGLDPGDSNGMWDVYAFDVDAPPLKLVSVDDTGAAAGAEDWGLSISEDGRLVSYVSAAPNLVAGAGNGREQVYLRDLDAETTQLVSIDLSGQPAGGGAWASSMNTDGTLVVFAAEGQQLSAIDDHGKAQIYLRNLTNQTTELVSLVDGSTDLAGSNDSDLAPGDLGSGKLVSDDGRFVAFVSRSPNDLTGVTSENWAAFVRDRDNNTTRLVSRSTDHSKSVGVSTISISGDGRYVPFTSLGWLYVEDRDCSTEYLYEHDLGPADPVDTIVDIIETITEMNLDNGISNSLDAKLDAALGALQDMNQNNDVAVCNSIQALENAISAQTPGKISEGQAVELLAGVHAMQIQMGCVE